MARRVLNLTEESKAEMLRLYVSERLGIVEIGNRFSASASTVARILKSKGVEMRKRGTRSPKANVAVNPLDNHTPAVSEEVSTFSV